MMQIIELTASITSAYLGRNEAAPERLPGIIQGIYDTLAKLGEPAFAEVEPAAPAVPIKSSVKLDAITCLCCGFKGKMLKRHLRTGHGLSPDAYRAMWGLPVLYPMAAPNYSERRRELALQIGLGGKAAPVKQKGR